LAYAESAEQGISVAKVNMASLTRSHQVPAVGLKILQSHTGRFDAADAGYPYDVWGDLERAVQTNEQQARKLASIGNRLFTLISNFGWEAAHGTIPTSGQTFDFSGTTGAFSSEVGTLTLSIDGQHTVFAPIGETLGFLASTNESTTTLLTVKKSGELLRLTINLESETETPAISEFAPTEPINIAEQL
jgi:hypothetical protein